ncbi:hypothetical protein CBR_g21104 [Chara braunii]|uniref:Uncharacterized protein n=1 Tax=Chara braunii TaxID=69332 RepID=A0A388L0M6_CHABU|nr:hypothetical protein CBR_g21104 [Chara braunii]|eukprot:GBG75859.1 hypothetical protein CBR_g21104 [Chara braunii]
MTSLRVKWSSRMDEGNEEPISSCEVSAAVAMAVDRHSECAATILMRRGLFDMVKACLQIDRGKRDKSNSSSHVVNAKGISIESNSTGESKRKIAGAVGRGDNAGKRGVAAPVWSRVSTTVFTGIERPVGIAVFWATFSLDKSDNDRAFYWGEDGRLPRKRRCRQGNLSWIVVVDSWRRAPGLRGGQVRGGQVTREEEKWIASGRFASCFLARKVPSTKLYSGLEVVYVLIHSSFNIPSPSAPLPPLVILDSSLLVSESAPLSASDLLLTVQDSSQRMERQSDHGSYLKSQKTTPGLVHQSISIMDQDKTEETYQETMDRTDPNLDQLKTDETDQGKIDKTDSVMGQDKTDETDTHKMDRRDWGQMDRAYLHEADKMHQETMIQISNTVKMEKEEMNKEDKHRKDRTDCHVIVDDKTDKDKTGKGHKVRLDGLDGKRNEDEDGVHDNRRSMEGEQLSSDHYSEWLKSMAMAKGASSTGTAHVAVSTTAMNENRGYDGGCSSGVAIPDAAEVTATPVSEEHSSGDARVRLVCPDSYVSAGLVPVAAAAERGQEKRGPCRADADLATAQSPGTVASPKEMVQVPGLARPATAAIPVMSDPHSEDVTSSREVDLALLNIVTFASRDIHDAASPAMGSKLDRDSDKEDSSHVATASSIPRQKEPRDHDQDPSYVATPTVDVLENLPGAQEEEKEEGKAEEQEKANERRKDVLLESSISDRDRLERFEHYTGTTAKNDNSESLSQDLQIVVDDVIDTAVADGVISGSAVQSPAQVASDGRLFQESWVDVRATPRFFDDMTEMESHPFDVALERWTYQSAGHESGGQREYPFLRGEDDERAQGGEVAATRDDGRSRSRDASTRAWQEGGGARAGGTGRSGRERTTEADETQPSEIHARSSAMDQRSKAKTNEKGTDYYFLLKKATGTESEGSPDTKEGRGKGWTEGGGGRGGGVRGREEGFDVRWVVPPSRTERVDGSTTIGSVAPKGRRGISPSEKDEREVEEALHMAASPFSAPSDGRSKRQRDWQLQVDGLPSSARHDMEQSSLNFSRESEHGKNEEEDEKKKNGSDERERNLGSTAAVSTIEGNIMGLSASSSKRFRVLGLRSVGGTGAASARSWRKRMASDDDDWKEIEDWIRLEEERSRRALIRERRRRKRGRMTIDQVEAIVYDRVSRACEARRGRAQHRVVSAKCGDWWRRAAFQYEKSHGGREVKEKRIREGSTKEEDTRTGKKGLEKLRKKTRKELQF